MAIRVSTLCFTSLSPNYAGADPLGQRMISPFGGYPTMLEAAPFYTSVSARLRITGGPNNGYDGTATWTRVPLGISNSLSPSVYGDGLDVFPEDLNAPTGTDCIMVSLYDAESEWDIRFFRDPKKPRIWIFGVAQMITSGSIAQSIGLPLLYRDPALSPSFRNPYRYMGNISGAYFDLDTLTDAQWRDMRGTYSGSYTSGGVTTQYDFTIA